MAEAKPIDAEAMEKLMLALQLLQQALANLDCAQAPADIGAHVDHAIACLNRFLSEPNH